MAQAYSDVVAVQIEAITPLLTDFFDMEMGLYEKFEKIQSKTQSGRNIRMPIELHPGGQMRAVNLDNGALGTGSAPTYDFTAMSPVDSVFALSWSLKAKFTTDSDAKSVVDTVQRALASGIEGAKIHVDKHLQTAGTGALALVTGATSGTSTVVTCNNLNFGVRLLRFGDPVSVFTSAAQTALRGNGFATVNAINYQAKTFTCDDTNCSGITSGDVIGVGGLTTSGIAPVYLFGIPYHQNNANTGTWLTWIRANYPEVRTPTVAAGGNSLTLDHIYALLAYLDGELGEQVTETGSWFWYMNPRNHVSLLQQMSMISEIELTNAKGGNPEVDLAFTRKRQRTLSGFPVITSINADATRVDFIDVKNWLRGVYRDLAFQKLGGSTVVPVPNSTSYDATEISYLIWSQQFAMKNPRRGAYISGLVPPV